MRYAVIGAAGQLGRDLCPRLPGEVIPLGRDCADLTRPDQLRATLTEVRPDVVINCAAYNLVDKAESEPQAAFAVNACGVRDLAAACRDQGLLLVHLSTDYVFGLDETRRTPWSEDDAPGPLSVYGASKLAGEYLARATWPRHLVVRTCGLYGVWGSGGKGSNFVETMLRLATAERDLRVVTDQQCTPSYTVDVAAATVSLLQAGRTGLIHVTNAGSCSWFEFARTIFALAGLKPRLTPITASEYGAAARRPAYSVLSTQAYQALKLPPLRSWQDALVAYLAERQKRPRA
jgi:dTDP-4-dehydrorhamnose reductase